MKVGFSPAIIQLIMNNPILKSYLCKLADQLTESLDETSTGGGDVSGFSFDDGIVICECAVMIYGEWIIEGDGYWEPRTEVLLHGSGHICNIECSIYDTSEDDYIDVSAEDLAELNSYLESVLRDYIYDRA